MNPHWLYGFRKVGAGDPFGSSGAGSSGAGSSGAGSSSVGLGSASGVHVSLSSNLERLGDSAEVIYSAAV